MAEIDVGKHTSVPYSTYATNLEGIFFFFFVHILFKIIYVYSLGFVKLLYSIAYIGFRKQCIFDWCVKVQVQI